MGQWKGTSHCCCCCCCCAPYQSLKVKDLLPPLSAHPRDTCCSSRCLCGSIFYQKGKFFFFFETQHNIISFRLLQKKRHETLTLTLPRLKLVHLWTRVSSADYFPSRARPCCFKPRVLPGSDLKERLHSGTLIHHRGLRRLVFSRLRHL